MDITLLPPSTILSRHSHLALLPSPFPNTPLKSGYHDGFDRSGPSFPRVPYRLRKRYEACPPADGSSPISGLPDELMLSIFSYLDWEELVCLRPVSRRWADLAITPSLHTSLTLSSLPTPLPPVLRTHLLRSVRHLYLHLFPYPTHRSHHASSALLDLLDAIAPGQLRSLSLPFSAPYVSGRDLGVALRRIGSHLEHLDLKGSGLAGSKWTGWVSDTGKHGPGLSALDLGFTSISTLPVPGGGAINPFRSIRKLSLASCTYLSEATLAAFLADLPSSIEQLDLSRLDNVSFDALWRLKVVGGGECGNGEGAEMEPREPTRLKEIKVVGIDHLTRRDVRRLKAHWEEQRRACIPDHEHLRSPISVFPIPIKWGHKDAAPFKPLSPPASPHTPDPVRRALSPSPPTPHQPFFEGLGTLPTPPRSTSPPERLVEHVEPDGFSVNIIHSAILESEDEEGYRQFIGEVAGATTLPGGTEAGAGLGLGLYVTSRGAGWDEVDGGGAM